MIRGISLKSYLNGIAARGCLFYFYSTLRHFGFVLVGGHGLDG